MNQLFQIKEKVFIALLLFVICFSIYGKTLENDFALDDYSMIIERASIHSFRSLLPNLDFSDMYDDTSFVSNRPVSHFFRVLLFHFFGTNPIFYHLVNIILFFIYCYLIFLLILKICENFWIACLASILFCTHPINTVSVNFVTAHEILLYGIFGFLSLLFLLFAFENNFNKKKYFISLTFFVLSFLTHPIILTLPFYVILCLWYKSKYKVKDMLLISIPYFFLELIYIIFRLTFSNQTSSLIDAINHLGILKYFFTIIELIFWYTTKIFLPADIVLICNMYSFSSYYWIGVFIVLLIGLFLIYKIFTSWKSNIKSFACIWFVIGFFPLGIVTIVYYSSMGLIIEPHWFLLSSVGIFILFSSFLEDIKNRFGNLAPLLIFLFLTLFWGLSTISYSNVYKNQKIYCTYWLEKVPIHNIYGLRGLATAYFKIGEYYKTLYYLDEALKYGRHHVFYLEKGYAYWKLNKIDDAKKNYFEAYKMKPDDSRINNAIGTIFVEEKDFDRAEKYFLASIKFNPNQTTAKLNLADLNLMKKNYEKSIYWYEQVIESKPDHEERIIILSKLGALYLLKGNFEISQQYIEKVINEDPGPGGFLRLSYVLYSVGLNDPAIALLKTSLNTYPNYPETYLFLGTIFANQNKLNDAIEVWEKGKKINSKNNKFQENINKALKYKK